MRPVLPALILAFLLAGVAVAADQGTMQQKDGFRDAATAPLEDLNIKRATVPDVLKRAVAAPYDLAGLDHCEAIAGEVGRLDAVLGPDLDEAPPPDNRSRLQKAGSAAHDAGVTAVRDETRSLLPFRGWIRMLTGANRQQKAVDQAIRSGGVRRGYLKGVGMRMNCAPPAAPSWFKPVHAATPRAEKGGGVVAAMTGLWSRIVAWFWSWWPF